MTMHTFFEHLLADMIDEVIAETGYVKAKYRSQILKLQFDDKKELEPYFLNSERKMKADILKFIKDVAFLIEMDITSRSELKKDQIKEAKKLNLNYLCIKVKDLRDDFLCGKISEKEIKKEIKQRLLNGLDLFFLNKMTPLPIIWKGKEEKIIAYKKGYNSSYDMLISEKEERLFYFGAGKATQKKIIEVIEREKTDCYHISDFSESQVSFL